MGAYDDSCVRNKTMHKMLQNNKAREQNNHVHR